LCLCLLAETTFEVIERSGREACIEMEVWHLNYEGRRWSVRFVRGHTVWKDVVASLDL